MDNNNVSSEDFKFTVTPDRVVYFPIARHLVAGKQDEIPTMNELMAEISDKLIEADIPHPFEIDVDYDQG